MRLQHGLDGAPASVDLVVIGLRVTCRTKHLPLLGAAPRDVLARLTLAELIFGVTHEGAVDVDDLLDRRTRVGLVPQDRRDAEPMAERALQHAASSRALPADVS